MAPINTAKITFLSRSSNEAFARGAVAAFVSQLDPTVAALSNCTVHAYPDAVGKIELTVALYEQDKLVITVADKGVGIPDVEQAMQPMFTTGRPDERAGLGFAVMQSFMDKLKVRSHPGKGTRVTMTKYIRRR